MTLGILGNGSWATALAKILNENGHKFYWWMRDLSAANHIKEKQHNLQYLSSVYFSDGNLIPTTSIEDILTHCENIIICIPSAYIEDILKDLPKNAFKNKKIISAIKGVLPSSAQLLNDYLVQDFDFSIENYISISGPCHAEEVAQERLSYLTFSGLNSKHTEEISSYFTSPYIRTAWNNDVWGAQYAAVLKNIYAIGAGIAHGLGYGDNFMSVYITNCYGELYKFLTFQFNSLYNSDLLPDFHTSAYLGDLLVTCYSLHSRNRTFGSLIGKGYSIQSAIAEMNMVAEGYYALRSMQIITEQMGITLPIMNIISSTIQEKSKVKENFKRIECLLS